MMRRGRARLTSFPCWSFDCRRQQVIHEGPTLHVAALVVIDLLYEGDGEALRQSAMNLAVNDHRIYDVAAVVDCYETADLDLARPFVDVDHADVRAERKGEIGRIVIVHCFETGFHALGHICVSCEGYVLDRLCLAGSPFDKEFARLPV